MHEHTVKKVVTFFLFFYGTDAAWFIPNTEVEIIEIKFILMVVSRASYSKFLVALTRFW